ncbi:barstar family protein [Dyella lutea]|uniref:Barstar family protein n=1 Tax=Dyella lutea TaxID=2950441 RepID=A0ABT1FH26_9GAMM|nr:barstar family protein [Dyella lutea]MCP1375748.1 barstar family protein [Dyella lutea]
MTTRVLGIDLHDAGRDGVYRVDPDDPVTLVGDAQRAGLQLARIDLADCGNEAAALERIAAQAGLPPAAAGSWAQLDAALRADEGAGRVLLFDHAVTFCRASPDAYAASRRALEEMARAWHARGVPFFVFMAFPDNETRDAAIDA